MSGNWGVPSNANFLVGMTIPLDTILYLSLYYLVNDLIHLPKFDHHLQTPKTRYLIIPVLAKNLGPYLLNNVKPYALCLMYFSGGKWWI